MKTGNLSALAAGIFFLISRNADGNQVDRKPSRRQDQLGGREYACKGFSDQLAPARHLCSGEEVQDAFQGQ